MKDLNIVKANKNNCEDILSFVKKISDYHIEIDSYYKKFKDYKNLKKDILKSFDDRNTVTFLALKNNKAIGYGVTGIIKADNDIVADKIGYIHVLITDKKYRGLGVGQELFMTMMKWLESKKIKHVELDVDARNVLGLSFWSKNKFFTYKHKMKLDL